ncbi:MAG: hypothetical protein RBU23_01485 [Candidatus Auribacterota bacterium]|jgi:hypothetical protein|nr:hypothetical protein [Candidatus Auribacterota bacterium]
MKKNPSGNKLSIPLSINESDGFARKNEPVTIGIPFPQKLLSDTDDLRLINHAGSCIPVQFYPTAYWPDGSIKWLLIDTTVSIAPNTSEVWFLTADHTIPASQITTPLSISQTEATITVESINRRYVCSKRTFLPFAGVAVDDTEIVASELTMTMLEDHAANLYQPYVRSTTVETEGSLRVTIRQDGTFRADGVDSPIDFIARMTFYALSDKATVSLTIRNTRAAHHQGNLWDLGDPGSFLFRELSITLGIRPECAHERAYVYQSGQEPIAPNIHRLLIYQDSSGGLQWNSPAHIGSDGQTTVSFRGYRISTDGLPVKRGDRIEPAVIMSGKEACAVAAIDKFWQQFPTALGFDDSCITIELFARHSKTLHELQGGEQKTHTMTFMFGKTPSADSIRSIHHPINVHANAKWYCASGVFPSLTPVTQKSFDRCDKLVMGAVRGKSTFFDRRELTDEYGWRHFGDLYADHEAVGHTGKDMLISHYNNQYDVIYGAQKQFARTGDIRWFRLMDELARHVIDIDIYHTDADRQEYNHGLFWHTDHYTDAATCTHRTYSKKNMIAKGLTSYGGGPSPSHNYTTGLLTYYYMTGNTLARESFMELMRWTVCLMASPVTLEGKLKSMVKNILRTLKEIVAGEPVEPYSLNGPGRASGNVLSALLDGWTFTGEDSYLMLAEKLIRKCVSPDENLDRRKLFCTEMRWMYLVFLIALIKYMILKEEYEQRDDTYHYARKSLLNYARYMADHEYPFLSKPEKLEYPNETWGAQEMRKSVVFNYASIYAKTGAEQKRFEERAEFFYRSSLDDIYSFPTRTLTRPIVLLMMYGHIHHYFISKKEQ